MNSIASATSVEPCRYFAAVPLPSCSFALRVLNHLQIRHLHLLRAVCLSSILFVLEAAAAGRRHRCRFRHHRRASHCFIVATAAAFAFAFGAHSIVGRPQSHLPRPRRHLLRQLPPLGLLAVTYSSRLLSSTP